VAKHYRDFDRHRRERVKRDDPVFAFPFGGEEFEFAVKPSFAMMETFALLEEELAERTEGDPDLKDRENAAWVFRKCAEVMELCMGAENWARLKRLGVEMEDILELLQWIGDTLAEENAARRGEEAAEEEEEAAAVGAGEAPGEGAHAPK
jgi:hypothetical protein